ncbi:MAG: hypothetical protein LC772_08605 [Chloroflexi bacterium]|nr:hypothetical protein [Chloroflexota bacterium]
MKKWAAAAAATTMALGGAAWLWHQQQVPTPPKTVYSSAGYGGYVPAKTAAKPVSNSRDKTPATPSFTPAGLLQPARRDYEAGRYLEAEKTAQRVIVRTPAGASLAERFQAVEARSLMAYSAARRNDLSLARERFGAMKVEAAKLPGGGKQTPRLGEDAQPALTEDAAYQHAVCTAALGDRKGAEAEYVAFMKQYPESPLMEGKTARRIAVRSRMPGGADQEEKPGDRSQEPGARSQEPGARSQEPGARSRKPGARSRKPGARSQIRGRGAACCARPQARSGDG